MSETINNQQTQQTTQPSGMPIPQNPGFMQSDPNDLSFLFNEDSGQLEIVPKSQVQSIPAQADQPFQNAVATQQTTQVQNQQEQQPQITSEDRLTRIEQGFAGLINYLQTQEQQKLNNSITPQNQQPQEVDLNSIASDSNIDFTDPKNIVALINLSVQNAIKTHVQPLNQVADQVKVKNSFDFAAAKYGQEFMNFLPKVKVLMDLGVLKSDPNISFENLFLAFKRLDSMNQNSANSDSTNGTQAVNGSTQNGTQPQTVQGLVQKANALSTETGGVQRTIINNKPKTNSIEDAVNNAWEELWGQK